MHLSEPVEDFTAGEKVEHEKYGKGYIRILKPSDKSYVEFMHGKRGGEKGDSYCVWVSNSELVKEN